jgi:DNA modification methylase
MKDAQKDTQSQQLVFETWPIERCIDYARNPRKNDHAVDKVAAAMREFGFRVPICAKSDGTVVDGHLRLKAAKKLGLSEVPVVLADDMTEAQIKAFRLSVNKVAELAEWDNELLALEIDDLRELGFDLELTGFELDEIDALFPQNEMTGLTDDDAVPEVPAVPVTVEGDVWLLGRHRLMCGDSTSIDAVERLMDGRRAALLHADPPYGMGKEGDGVANDNLYDDKLDSFQMEWWATFRTFLEDNASAYIWGNAPDLWRLWYRGGLADSERFTFRNQILWHQEGVSWGKDGMANLRQYANMGEHCLFFMLGEQGFNNNSDNYWEGWEPIRFYLESEMKKAGWTVKDLNKITGTQMAGHWVTKSQWSLITDEHYAKIQSAARDHDAFQRDHDAFQRDHDALKRDHDALKRDFYATRAYFDSSHDQMTDVWRFDRVKGEERHGHATPKPVAMMERVMKSSLPKDGLCVEPFGGSGSTLMGAEKTGRICYTIELQAKYCDVIIKRWQDFTGQQATLEATGQTFAELQAEREAA